jgi:hypothetical protein
MNEMEDEFYEIAQEAIERANHVECSVEDYQAGLRSIMDEFSIALQASIECSED